MRRFDTPRNRMATHQHLNPPECAYTILTTVRLKPKSSRPYAAHNLNGKVQVKRYEFGNKVLKNATKLKFNFSNIRTKFNKSLLELIFSGVASQLNNHQYPNSLFFQSLFFFSFLLETPEINHKSYRRLGRVNVRPLLQYFSRQRFTNFHKREFSSKLH